MEDVDEPRNVEELLAVSGLLAVAVAGAGNANSDTGGRDGGDLGSQEYVMP